MGSDAGELSRRIDVIERGYEYLLAYAAQGRQHEGGSEARQTLERMHAALDGFGDLARAALPPHAGAADGTAAWLDALARDAAVARGAVALVLNRPAIASLLVDNLNASVHLRALLTDVFLLEQALKAA